MDAKGEERLMRKTRRLRLGLVLAGAGLAVAFVAGSSAAPPHEPDLSNVAAANTRAVGYAPDSKFSTEIAGEVVAQGATPVENPTALTGFYGYQNDVVSPGDPTKPQMVPTQGIATEAQKTEPDENAYLSFKRPLNGPDPDYYYGKDFLYQGHEAAASVGGVRQGYITRINLDADARHRVTLLATRDSSGAAINTIDGVGWDPWAQKLIFTTENANAPTYAATPDYPSTVVDVSGALGRGGYEGVALDSEGNITILEDIGGANKPGTTARIPNSFLFRYVPESPGDLAHGKLEVLQVLNNVNHQPITQATETPLNSPDQLALHTYGSSFDARWVTVHDTAVDGNAPFNANTLAKAKDGTPFKRPENGRFRPGTGFTDLYFDETGDTNATSPENATAGGWCSIFRLSQSSPGASTGQLSIFYKCDGTRAGFDNAAFLSRDLITFVEDAGDTLHGQRNALDSGWVFDVTTDYSDPSNQPVRWLAEGRDPSATIDSAAGGFGKNDGDNEITGSIVSDGDPTVHGLLGAKNPHLFQQGDWRFFYTEQHGDNRTYEVVERR
jgi:hypothetical protein